MLHYAYQRNTFATISALNIHPYKTKIANAHCAIEPNSKEGITYQPSA